MHKDPTATSTHYALTELGDETRHMVMFGKAIERVGAKPFQPTLVSADDHQRAAVGLPGSLLWVAALIGEEIFDALQRQMMDDPELQPMVQRLMRIHVTEEARHIQFARDGARKRVAEMPRINRILGRQHQRSGRLLFRSLFTNPVAYRRAGLDGRARPAGSPAPARTVTRFSGWASLRWPRSFEEVGLMGPIARRMWKHNQFL